MQKYQEKIDNLNSLNAEKIEEIKETAFKVFSKRMKRKMEILANARIELENSKNLTLVEWDDYVNQFIDFDFSQIIDTKSRLEIEFLKRFLEENDFFMHPNIENSVLTMSIGPAIVIDHDGTVYDQDAQKVILSGSVKRNGLKDYETEKERNEKIEEYMEKTGWFPGVVQLDYYGQPIRFINTQSEE